MHHPKKSKSIVTKKIKSAKSDANRYTHKHTYMPIRLCMSTCVCMHWYLYVCVVSLKIYCRTSSFLRDDGRRTTWMLYVCMYMHACMEIGRGSFPASCVVIFYHSYHLIFGGYIANHCACLLVFLYTTSKTRRPWTGQCSKARQRWRTCCDEQGPGETKDRRPQQLHQHEWQQVAMATSATDCHRI